MKAAYIANQFPAAVEPYVWEEVRELRKRGVEIVCCSVHPVQPEKDAQMLADETVNLLPLRVALIAPATLLLLWRIPRLKTTLKRACLAGNEPLLRRVRAIAHTWLGAYYALLLRKSAVHHIHAHHGYSAAWIAMVAARLLGVTFSLTLHGSDLLIHHAYLDYKLAACNFCLTISHFNRQHILEQYPQISAEKVIVRRLGVETSLRETSGPRDDESLFLMLAVGRLHRVKNHGFLLRSCRALKDEGLKFLCLILGEGPERRALERQISLLNLNEEVKLFGQVPRQRLDAYYSACDLVVLTSHSEGLPLVLMEAMAHQKTVLAPEITGIPELVVPGKTGFLYTPGSLEDFVAKAKQISLTRAALLPLRREARRHVVQHFNRATNLAAFAELFISRVSNSAPEASADENPVLQQIQL